MALKVVVVGLGQMGRSHALAYHQLEDFEIIALVNRSQPKNLPEQLARYNYLKSLSEALLLKPDVVAICTHTDSHAALAIEALEARSHIFIEKPLAATVSDAKSILATANRVKRKVVVGYILQHHPSWSQFISHARNVGPPFVFRMNLNQQSRGTTWDIHRKILQTTSPAVDCGVHYIDLMLRISDSRPVQVRGVGVRLTDEIPASSVNYSHLQITFEDGSAGWYEAAWGPMVSETAYFVKDVIGPRGSVSVIPKEGVSSADVDRHTNVGRIRVHHTASGEDEIHEIQEEPDHQRLCRLEQEFFYRAIVEDVDLGRHLEGAIMSLQIVLAADESMRLNRAVDVPSL